MPHDAAGDRVMPVGGAFRGHHELLGTDADQGGRTDRQLARLAGQHVGPDADLGRRRRRARHDGGQEVCAPEELGDEHVARAAVEVGGRAQLADHAVTHHADAVREDERLVLIVGDVDRRRLGVLLDPPYLGAEVLAQVAVERPQRLVEQQDAGSLGQRSTEGDALLLAAAQLVGQSFTETSKGNELEDLVDASDAIAAPDLLDLEAELDVAGTVRWGNKA